MAARPLPSGLSAAYWRSWAPRHGLTVHESLEVGEEWIGSWDSIGLYEGNNKVPQYQDLTVHLTTHRLLIMPATPVVSSSNSSISQGSSKAPSASSIASGLQTSMSNVRQTELYVGFMRSSPKITLSLGRVPTSQQAASSSSRGETSASGSRGGTNPGSNGVQALTASSTNSNMADNANASISGGGGGGGWTCPVCGYVNPLNEYGQVASSEKCGLCGITYGKSASMGPNGRAPVSGSGSGVSSLAPSRSGTPAPAPGPASRLDLTPSSAQTQDFPNSPSAPGPAEAASVGGGEGKAIACPACTFLNHPSLRNCEICSSALPRSKAITSTSTGGIGASASDATEAGLGGEAGKLEIVRLSFRKGGVQECYRRLKNVLSDKAWERAEVASQTASGADTFRGAGIDGILQSMRHEAKAKDSHMQDAFKDLEVLMVRAGEMVRLAQSLSAKLPATTANSEEETLIQTSLVQLGLPTPALTQDMVRDEQIYLEGLARELGGILTGRTGPGLSSGKGKGLMVGEGSRGVIGLDEVWVIWQRARGVSLLSPATLISIIPLLPKYTEPQISLLTLPSSLKVLHTPQYSTQAFLERIIRLLEPEQAQARNDASGTDAFENTASSAEKSLSAFELATQENLAIGLTKDLLEAVEMVQSPLGPGRIGMGMGIVRDEQGGSGTRWYRDLISEWSVEQIKT